MGEVAVTIRIMPEGPDSDAAYIKSRVKELGANNIIEKPIGFGLRMLEAIFIFDDRQGANTDGIEEKIRQIKGVASVETGDAALI
ncbi:MAG: elongation factor 1-beta [Candidatus Aenigmarchaeota archaeon]|nr:elongation factor 1-beta [Candidatus Aenigmarchaeota archaeon]